MAVEFSINNTADELRALCNEAGLETGGTKAEMIDRLNNYYLAAKTDSEWVYTREELLRMKKFRREGSLVRSLMSADEKLSPRELDARINGYLKEVING